MRYECRLYNGERKQCKIGESRENCKGEFLKCDKTRNYDVKEAVIEYVERKELELDLIRQKFELFESCEDY